MVENFALYSSKLTSLPDDQMKLLVDEMEPAIASAGERGRCFTYSWPDLEVACSEMPAWQMPEHLRGFAGYLCAIGSSRAGVAAGLVEALSRITLVVGVEVRPGRDMEGRAEELVGKLVSGLEALVFYGGAVYDQHSTILLAPEHGTQRPESSRG